MRDRHQLIRALRRAALLLAVLALPAPSAAAAVPATVARVGAWCWFADPRAIEYRGRAVFGWVADDGSVMVGDDSGRRFALAPGFERDDHDNPAFLIRRDGRLIAFWSAHAGDALLYRVSSASGIGAWGPTQRGPVNPPGASSQYTYPNPRRVGSTLFLFWSGTENTATFSTSPDDGATWRPARLLFRPGLAVRYVKYVVAGDAIHMAWTLVHPRWQTSPVYHAVIRRGRIERMDGTVIGRLGTPLDPVAGDVVYDPARDGGAWVHDIEIDRGAPVIAFATFPTLLDHAYHYARWSGSGWRDERIAMAGPSFDTDAVNPEHEYSGGINLDPVDPRVAWLSRQVGGSFEIERWTRGARGWTSSAITHGSRLPNVRPYPLGAGVAWMAGAYPGFTQFRTALVWLPRLPRAAAPARTTPVR